MDRTERFYKIDHLLHSRRIVPIDRFLQTLEVSKATFRRDLEYLRERFHAPIVYDRQQRGYRLTEPDPDAPRYELPGLWFNSAEIHALLTFYQLLDNLQPGLLGPHIEPLKARIQTLLEKTDHAFEQIAQRIRLLPLAARSVKPDCFDLIAHAVLKRKRLNITHYNRARDEQTTREVSPQRLVHYRDNWYLDAWCHKKNALRTFAVDSIRHAALTEKKAQNIADATLDAELGAGYGIFAGRRTRTARLRFTPERARWVANERWHPQQRSYAENGHYVLEIPYSDDRELLMDILKYGPDVEVLEPESLRDRVRERLQQAAAQYNK